MILQTPFRISPKVAKSKNKMVSITRNKIRGTLTRNGEKPQRNEKKKKKAIAKMTTGDLGVSMKMRGKWKRRNMKKEDQTKEINEKT